MVPKIGGYLKSFDHTHYFRVTFVNLSAQRERPGGCEQARSARGRESGWVAGGARRRTRAPRRYGATVPYSRLLYRGDEVWWYGA